MTYAIYLANSQCAIDLLRRSGEVRHSERLAAAVDTLAPLLARDVGRRRLCAAMQAVLDNWPEV